MFKELAGDGSRLTLFYISATGSLAVPLLKITTLLHTETAEHQAGDHIQDLSRSAGLLPLF